MEISNNIEEDIENNLTIEKKQNKFLQSTTWKIVNSALNAGLRYLLPNLVENEVINIKDQIINNGLKTGVKEAVNSAIELGKSVKGIFTGNFENITQAQNAIKSGGIIDSMSSLLNKAVIKCVNKNLIKPNTAKIILNGKNVILNTIESNIENNFQTQLSSTKRLEKYSNNWKIYYEKKDFEGMEKEYKKIKSTLKEILPVENIIKEVRKIENIHLLIKNNGKNFNLSNKEINLANELI